ncbi:NfeD family protein [Nocardioides daphniae]|uniref:Membrane protein n=1 Tax=Nocardioides daphniae TaxID=402297 RepID=A0A4P7UD46_9ACTN|nr:NfeD family protein [Nocardioides daphniae]QCC77275.1 NfeD family protein [Nocardioides daphniae]GGD25845.1 membrane protein [Nocardioides daphniae]
MDWFGDHVWQTWLGVAFVLGVLELFSLDLILIMLAMGALVGMVAALLGVPVVLQVILAAVAALAALALARPSIARRMHGGPELALGHGKLVGQRGVVTQQVTALNAGRIKLAGEIWSAVPLDETVTIEPGEPVEVIEIRGATAVVYPISTPGV